jgi:RNA polymerase sigma-70 factor (ECF subfamily)
VLPGTLRRQQRPNNIGADVKDDEHFIELTLSGDTAAFGHLVQKYQDRLYNTLVHVCGCANEAEEVAQDAFVIAFQRLSTFQRRSTLYTWLYRIAMNNWISKRRLHRSHLSVDAVRDATGQEPIDSAETPAETLERVERLDQIRSAIDELNDEHRGVLVLRDIEGCCYEQISEILSIPIGTVRSRLHRARMHLKMRLAEVLHENI